MGWENAVFAVIHSLFPKHFIMRSMCMSHGLIRGIILNEFLFVIFYKLFTETKFSKFSKYCISSNSDED